MAYEATQFEAAQALFNICKGKNIKHAIIGGYAVHLLGHSRETHDIDVEIDMTTYSQDQLTRLLNQEDPRFTVEHLKLSFKGASGTQIPIETLPIGSLGLPLQLRIATVGDSGIQVLHPSVLILAKLKRCVHYIGSTRPRSRQKFDSDMSDITYLLEWLVENGEKIDFVGYQAANVDRLYEAVKKLVEYWDQEEDMTKLLMSVLEPQDRERVMRSVYLRSRELRI